MNKNSSLIVVGSGIKFMSHLTVEAKTYIEQSDKVLYLVNDPLMQKWIQETNPRSESLDSIYIKYPLRIHCYQAITNYILENLRKNINLCVVLYGHPTVYAKPALDAVKLAIKEGYDARILPGISAEDCLLADLLINPGIGGCQSLEATDLLIRKRIPDVSSHLILWQVGIIGLLGHSTSYDNSKGIKLLVEYLSQYYDFSDEVILYEAAQYPGFKPKIQKLTLNDLPAADMSALTTLYIPPIRKISCNQEMLLALNIDIADLQQDKG